MAKKLNIQQALDLLQSDEIYSSCDDSSDFDETEVMSLSSENTDYDDDGVEEFDQGHKHEHVLNFQEI